MKLYDHCYSIINNYHEEYSKGKDEKSLKSFDLFMVNKVLSMDYDLLDVAEAMNRYIGDLSVDDYVKAMSSLIPSDRYDLKYKGKKSNNKTDERAIELIAFLYDVPHRDAEMYYEELSQEQIDFILEKYGIYQ